MQEYDRKIQYDCRKFLGAVAMTFATTELTLAGLYI